MRKNYTTTTSRDYGQGYSTKVRRNVIAPKDKPDEPLTVIEFSLTEPTRDSLKMALDAIDYPADNALLANLMERHMPRQVMEDLHQFAHTKGSRTVYVIHNLPEQEKDVFKRKKYDGRTNPKIIKDSYSEYIQCGISEALKLESHSVVDSLRDLHVRHSSFRLKVADDDTIHRDSAPITAFGGLISDGTPTRFIDLRAVLDNVREKYPEKKALIRNLQHVLDRGAAQLDHGHYHAIQPMMRANAQEIVVESGSLALWANDGDIFHQSLASRHQENPLKPDDIASRIMFRTYHQRPR
ncbi:MAG: hypothetical protein K2Q01_01355 [Rickettsiales bacterium]|nr:hypothetical protein [Rickettsiales bacterium]